MKRSIKAYAYVLAEEWYFSKYKLGNCSEPPEKVKVAFLPGTPHETKNNSAVPCASA